MRFFFLFFSFLYALEINISFLKKNSTPIEILTLYSKTPVSCISFKDEVKCIFNKPPKLPIFKTKSIYFEIIPIVNQKKLVLIIKVKNSFFLKSFKDNLYNEGEITPFEYKKAKKWVIIAPYKKIKTPEGLKFYFVNSPKIFIGAIDEKGNPLNLKEKSEDIVAYFSIVRRFKKNKPVLDDINQFIENYPNSLFLPDVLYIKMKVLDKEGKFDEIIEIGKEWVKKYAYNENLPEVLLLMAKSYSKLGFLSEASYLYERIIDEYPKTKFAYLAMIYWADQLYSVGESKKALALYKKALYLTDDINIASLAAMRLAQRYIDKGDINIALEYYKRVYNSNKEFILKDKQKAFELAKNLAAHKAYDLAIKIGEDLLKRLKKLDDLYEPLEYYLALWSYEKKDYKNALKWIDKYLNDFPYGEYSDAVTALREKVLFEVPDSNLTKQLEEIDKIIEKYKDSDIAKKALLKKIEILEKLKKYREILEILKSHKELLDKKYRKKIATKLAISLLKDKKCFEFTQLIKEEKITLDKKYDEEVYKCAMKARDYKLASVVCNKYLDLADDKLFAKWIKRKILALEGLGDYENVVKGVEDLCQVEKSCYEWRLKEFFALWKLKRYKEAIKIATEYLNKKDIKSADAYIKIVNYALKNNDYLMAATFAKKIIDLQNYFKAYPYSPFVEFTYAKYSKNKKEAIQILKELLQRVKGEDKARALYMLANLSGKKEYLQKCIKVKDSTLWKKLCNDALNLF